ncbi:nucleoside triphosphate pyrophosphohydrolase family protein [Bacillus toyonensis]|uniref:nucleoside triphosphate pyrophosphohydrolase family protein n=1 Tax=Bacillus toyonensis TaxID=155322 RepID=UPI000BF5ABA6|nr:nucleoside triphosphate pyrophosphohydrolase family protein [Bacillus toyonensis]PGF00905.1 hypothetical protein COM61_22785 [Bacillus toyonensis]PHE47032.1 hypothetical protein COF71_13535 [Bacillus toyonensis]
MDELRINELNDYQERALRTWNTDSNADDNFRITNAALGLAGESSEIADIIKKAIYHGHGFEGKLSKHEIAKELGDIMYYVSIMAEEVDYSLQEIAEININKLAKRYPEGFSVEASINRVDTKEAH